jgi:hypothetical protein
MNRSAVGNPANPPGTAAFAIAQRSLNISGSIEVVSQLLGSPYLVVDPSDDHKILYENGTVLSYETSSRFCIQFRVANWVKAVTFSRGVVRGNSQPAAMM